jgi:hypothetical protein
MKQTTTGYIALYDKDGDILQLRRYKHLARRREILDTWRRLYGPRFSELSYGINPDLCPLQLQKLNLNEYEKLAA